MSDVFKLPGSSYEELSKIIKAYSMTKEGLPVSLAVVAQTAAIDKTVVSRNNSFLVQVKLVSDGNKKSATEIGQRLGRAYQLNLQHEISMIWSNIVKGDDFLKRMVSAIRVKGEMEKSEYVNHIVFSSGNSLNNNVRAGAAAIIEIFKMIGLITEKDGRIMEGSGSILSEPPVLDEGTPSLVAKSQLPSDELSKEEAATDDTGYYIQAYTCESGKAAKFIIPEDATKDDLLACSDLLGIVLKRRFKLMDD